MVQIELHPYGVMFGIPYDFLRASFLLDTPLLRYGKREVNLYELSELYHENSKLRRSLNWRVGTWVAMFQRPDKIKGVSYIFSRYISAKKILLPIKGMQIKKRIDKVIVSRRSIRDFSPEPISLKELSKLLYYSYGITCCLKFPERVSGEEIKQYLRATPSGGALYPVEIYLAVLNVKGLVPGIYHYYVKEHALEAIDEDGEKFKEKFIKCFPVSPEIINLANASVIFILSASFWRSMAKYGSRAYRYVLQEAGHIAQNIYLIATALNLGCVALQAFYDDEINEWVGLDGVEQSVIYTLVCGRTAYMQPPFEPIPPDKLATFRLSQSYKSRR